MTQLDLFSTAAAVPTPPPAAPIERAAPAPSPAPALQDGPADQLGRAIIAAGFAHNVYQLDSNGPTVPRIEAAPWNLPSRLFTFPLVHNAPRRLPDGKTTPRTIALKHPLLRDHPGVQHVAATLGIEIGEDQDGFAFGSGRNGQWHHAVDLIDRDWRGLLATRQFTTDGDIARAVAFALRSKGRLSLKDARSVLAAIDCQQPDAATLDAAFAALDRTDYMHEKRRCRPLNWQRGTGWAVEAWATIVGIERGAFAYNGRFLNWTDKLNDMGSQLL